MDLKEINVRACNGFIWLSIGMRGELL
jgi:hypothetical protein